MMNGSCVSIKTIVIGITPKTLKDAQKLSVCVRQMYSFNIAIKIKNIPHRIDSLFHIDSGNITVSPRIAFKEFFLKNEPIISVTANRTFMIVGFMKKITLLPDQIAKVAVITIITVVSNSIFYTFLYLSHPINRTITASEAKIPAAISIAESGLFFLKN